MELTTVKEHFSSPFLASQLTFRVTGITIDGVIKLLTVRIQ